MKPNKLLCYNKPFQCTYDETFPSSFWEIFWLNNLDKIEFEEVEIRSKEILCIYIKQSLCCFLTKKSAREWATNYFHEQRTSGGKVEAQPQWRHKLIPWWRHLTNFMITFGILRQCPTFLIPWWRIYFCNRRAVGQGVGGSPRSKTNTLI